MKNYLIVVPLGRPPYYRQLVVVVVVLVTRKGAAMKNVNQINRLGGKTIVVWAAGMVFCS